MKILCSLSGLEFSCDYFPGTFYSKETYHPIFNLSQHRLLSYAGKWAAGELTPNDSYLLFLAILRSTGRVEFRTPVFRNEMTNSIIAQNMEHLMKITTKINTIVNPAVVFPKYVISADTRMLSNVRYWLDNWYSCYAEFQSGKIKDWDNRKLLARENALERLIKNPHKSLKEIAPQIAEWAATASEFPTGSVPSPWKAGEQITIDSYWKQIIVKCAGDFGMLGIPKIDVADLLEHCEVNIPIGTIFSNALFKILRGALERQKNFLGFDVDASTPKFTFLGDAPTATDDVETANLKLIVGRATIEEPQRKDYANSFLYLKAKVAWDMAQKVHKDTEFMYRRKDDPLPGQEPAVEPGYYDDASDIDNNQDKTNDDTQDEPRNSQSNDDNDDDSTET